MTRQISYEDSLKILGSYDSKALEAINIMLGGAILGTATATGHLEFLTLMHARDELLEKAWQLVKNLGQRARGAKGKSRTDLLVAAHAVVAIDAYFKALRDLDLPFKIDRLELTQTDQIALSGASTELASQKLAEALIRTPLPRPLPHFPFEHVVREMRTWYGAMSGRLTDLIKGLAIWDELDETKQMRCVKSLLQDLPTHAVAQYEEGFLRLASESQEFRIWTFLTDGSATRFQVAEARTGLESSLVGLKELLESLAAEQTSSDWPGKLAAAYQAHLERPVVESSPGEVHAGLTIPSIAEAYVNPRFRVTGYLPDARPSEDDWWQQVPISSDITRFLAGYLTSPVATEVPLLIVGEPGSGKSLFTKVLAARLPPEGYLPIRVELRHVAADAPVQDQIEVALREATGERMEWPELARAGDGALPVVMLDGFDELLQATEMSRSDYLEQVRVFQRREADQGRRVAVIVTSRIVVADRLRLPDGTVMTKLEPFDDAQVERWLDIWNEANVPYFDSSGLQRLSTETVLRHRELATQPLLLLMLALYDADENGLQQQSEQLARADLYEQLLSKFAIRELDKREPALDNLARKQAVMKELSQLSIVALAMFNRGRKAVSEEDLDADLEALTPTRAPREGGVASQISRRLTRAQLTVGRFFFMHKSQALVDSTRLNEYEFLHATFGEYLVARLVFHTLDRTAKLHAVDDPGLSLSSSAEPHDDQLWSLLSFALLTDGSQTIAFLNELLQKINGTSSDELRKILIILFRNSLRARPAGYDGYAPRLLNVPARHAAYSANLLILNALFTHGALPTSILFSSSDRAPEEWQSFAMLWKSQLEPTAWEGLVDAFSVTSKRGAPELLISTSNGVNLAKPLEEFQTVNWLAVPPSGADRSAKDDHGATTLLSHLEFDVSRLATEVAFLRNPHLDLLVHGSYPLLRRHGQFLDLLLTGPDGTTRSFVHSLISQLLEKRDSADTKDVEKIVTAILAASTSRNHFSELLENREISSEPSMVKTARYTSRAFTLLAATAGVEERTDSMKHVLNTLRERIQLDLAERTFDMGSLTYFTGISSLEDILKSVNPIELAEVEESLIFDVIKLAREKNFTTWAEKNGLSLLAALADSKLQKLPPEDFNFIMNSASNTAVHGNVITLIRDRYRADEAKPTEGQGE